MRFSSFQEGTEQSTPSRQAGQRVTPTSVDQKQREESVLVSVLVAVSLGLELELDASETECGCNSASFAFHLCNCRVNESNSLICLLYTLNYLGVGVGNSVLSAANC